MAIREVIKKAATFAAGCAGAVALLLSVFLFGKRTGKKESAVNVKADEAARKKESEIEKTPAGKINSIYGSDCVYAVGWNAKNS